MAQEDLIKTVRGLDQSGPGDNGEHLEHLWQSLTSSADSGFHAAEESSLRWLLRSMNGSTPAAETLRRYPLTWRLLACVFQRIPPFSLAKSLADRRFVAVLQQTLKDVSVPAATSASRGSSKRKRTPQSTFSLEDLKSVDGCVESIKAIFDALNCLLQRTEDTTALSPHDRIGAEHLKSLFGAPASEAVAIVAPLVRMCHLVLKHGRPEDLESSEKWIAIASRTWSLHLQSDDDMNEVAQHIYGPASMVLGTVGESDPGHQSSTPETLATKWRNDLQDFLLRTLILPAHSAFISRQNDKVFFVALGEATRDLDVAAPVMYELAAIATESLVLQGVRKGNSEWMKAVFRVVESFVRDRADRGSIMKKILQESRERSMPVDVSGLRLICHDYALHDGETDWVLVAHLAQCEPDVFQGEEDGTKLLKEVCSRSIGPQAPEDFAALSDVIDAIVRSFLAARELPSFLRLWFEQLSLIEEKKTKSTSPWTLVGQEGSSIGLSGAWFEKELSTKDMVDTLNWAETQKAGSKTLCLWLNAITQGITNDDYKDAACLRLSDLILKVKKSSSDITALKWRVISRAFAWAPLEKRDEIWSEIKDQLKKILKKSSLQSPETFEAFKCCSRIWVSLIPDGDQVSDAAKFVEDFTARVAEEIAAQGVADDDTLFSYLECNYESRLREETALQQYLAWYIRGSTRLNRLYFETKGELLPVLQKAESSREATPQKLEALWGGVLENEHCMNKTKLAEEVVGRAIQALDDSSSEQEWPGETGQVWIRLVSRIPLDAITRPQRERLAATLVVGSTTGKNPKRSLEGWRMVLNLAAKIMTRPTFFEGLSFGQLIGISDALSNSPVAFSGDDAVLGELIERFYLLASVIIKQMAEHVDERSVAFFEEAAAFVTRSKAEAAEDPTKVTPLHLTLLKALVIEISQSPSFRNHPKLASVSSDAQAALDLLVAGVIGEWVSDKKLVSKPNPVANFRLFGAVDAASSAGELTALKELKSSPTKKLEKRSIEAMRSGDLRGWKLQSFLQRYMPWALDIPRPVTFHNLADLKGKSGESHLREYVGAIVSSLSGDVKMQYLEALVREYHSGCETDGQLMAINFVVDQVITSSDVLSTPAKFDLSTVHSEMTRALMQTEATTHSVLVCRILYSLTERKPQAISQWNVESLLSSIAALSSQSSTVPFIWLCKLTEVIIKKHRVRFEDHYHILLGAMQPLLHNLIYEQRGSQPGEATGQESKASAYGRLISLVCEPTMGAVARTQHHSTLDSATDAAKRSAGRHMYMILMQYVKLQLDTHVSRGVREALEPGMNSIFDITTPEGRKILNDAMDGSGRAILREMFKRYTKFGKWSGV